MNLVRGKCAGPHTDQSVRDLLDDLGLVAGDGVVVGAAAPRMEVGG